ncbi:glycosyltransferase family 4 protein [Sphingobium bisphenolivorans]|uniref:glycosyltransferase family 4 protein n=1 Tax=Sphingobium bisphenolivorans TaxID=1335760 RepID=UPI0003A159A9|nr:glycosyltransferase family 1 protein [Sphingobium bisphenolivorans]
MKAFWDLLPRHVEQAVTSGVIRKLRARYQRRKIAPVQERALPTTRRLFIDLAVISRHDAGTGIQRVVRALALALKDEAAGEWDVRFVAADRRRPYHGISWPDASAIVDRAEIWAEPGDLFIGLDFSLDTIRRYRRQLSRFVQDGGRFWFLICDLLPVEKSDWFSPNNVLRYKAWLDTIVGLSEGFLCISEQTERDLQRVLATRYGLTSGYRTKVVAMGHDIRESLLDSVTVRSSDNAVRFDTSSPFWLMVGTLEPRKGHADILAAFSALWRQGADNRLVLVGRMGWRIDDLRDAIHAHPEYGDKLLWFDDIDDLELGHIYQACSGVIIASHAEGFGLPLIEALGHGKPVLARDLPIFRIHEGQGVHYFPADADAQELGACIQQWADHAQAGRINVVRPSASWKSSARGLLAAIA